MNNKKLSSEYRSTEDQLLSNIRIMSRYTQFDSITFTEQIIRNVDSIFYYFDALGDEISHELTKQDFLRLKKLPNSFMFYDPFQQHSYKKQSIGRWITQVFMKHISMEYLKFQLDQPTENGSLLKQKIKEFEKYWKIITPETKNQIIKKVLQKKPIDLYQQHRLMIKVTRNGFPLIQKSDQVPNLLKQILQANEKQIFDLLFYTKLNETLESHSILKFYITQEIEAQITNYEELQNINKKLSKNKKKNKQKKEAQSKMQVQKIEISKIIPEKGPVLRPSKQQEKKQIFGKQGDQQVIVKGNDLLYKKLEISETQQIICIEGTLGSSVKQQTTKEQIINENEKDTKNKKKRKKKKKHHQHQKEFALSQGHQKTIQQQSIIHEKHQIIQQYQNQNSLRKFSQQSSETTNDQVEQSKQDKNPDIKTNKLQNLSNVIQKKQSQDPLSLILKNMEKRISFYNKQRKIVINRLSYIFAQHELSFKIYGSTCCDVALPSSDIDIVVDPSIVNYFYFSYSNYRKKIINSLEYLQKVFEKFEWTSDFLILPGASIPLLTFTVNPGIDFQFQQGNYQYNNKKQLKQEIRISVDITIQPYINMTDEVPMHLGVESSQLIKEWISIFPHYSQLLILLKLFTKNHDLNKMYHGGISSFMQAIILTGFYKYFFMGMNITINEFQNKKEKFQEIIIPKFNLSKFFLEYCRFIMQFQQQKQIIDINSSQKYCKKPQNIPIQQLGIINPLTGKIMSQRCSQFKIYKKLIGQIYDVLYSKTETQINDYLKIVFQT